MAYTRHKTEYTGLRYREHPTRKASSRPGSKADRYFTFRHKRDGKLTEEALGWESEGMTLQKAILTAAELREEARLGKGTGKVADRREAQREAEEAAAAAAREEARLAVTYAEFYAQHYLPSLVHKKEATARRERELNTGWILPVIGTRPIRGLKPIDFDQVKRSILNAGKSPRTAQYALTTASMVMSAAIKDGFYVGANPVGEVKRPKFDNRRTRFLSREEADMLLAELAGRSASVHRMALLSLHTGLRLGEVYALCWSDVDLAHGVVTVRNTKSGRTRHVPMTDQVRSMFEELAGQADKGRLVFPSKTGEQRRGMISTSFKRAVAACGFNDGVDDKRQWVSFHTLRHSAASWMAMAGVELYTIGQILGHASLEMTARYSHLSPNKLRSAIDAMESALKPQAKVIPFKEVQHG